MVIEFPAPEEARTYRDYVALFRERNPGVDFKDACQVRGGNHKQYYDQCWKQPEAMQIHQVYKQH